MKKVLAFFLAAVICFSIIGCQQTEDQREHDLEETQIQETKGDQIKPEKTEPEETEPEETQPQRESTSTPLLYKVSDEDGDVVWLFGSIHVGVEEYYPLPDYVMDAFEGSDALAVEFDLVSFEKNLGAQIKAVQSLMYTDGSTIKDHIPEALYNRAVEIAEQYDMYNKAYDYYIPMMWVSLIDNILVDCSEADALLGVDRHMIEMAYEMDKPVLDVESAEFQYAMMAGFSDELQIMLLEESVAGFDDVDEYILELEEMIDIWMRGDEAAFAEMLSEEPLFDSAEEQVLYEEYNNAMVYERNLQMTEYAVDALENGEEIFICVGSAHVVGVGAMAQNLKELGYTVEVVQ